jgi:rhodanese-related sulfurtransferase
MKPREVRDFVRAHPEALLLDVRNAAEWNDDVGHMDGSRQIPLALLGGQLTEIEAWKHKPVITISRIGDRSAAAALVLREAGFTEVTNLEGGLEAWRKAGY